MEKKTLPEITGDKKKDKATWRKNKTPEFGLMLLEHYVPRNSALINSVKRNMKVAQIDESLKLILS